MLLSMILGGNGKVVVGVKEISYYVVGFFEDMNMGTSLCAQCVL